ncbi:MAG TPA: hypothetical protein VGS19_26430 [Streptosporangiaceae bacterium]|nr:hypothetical protein [Streptosporangiaceae bacterium]
MNLVFNCVNRLVHAFGLEWESDDHVRLNAKALHRMSYRVPKVLVR